MHFCFFIASEQEGLASGADALNVLENTDTRNLFIDELLEVGSGLFVICKQNVE